MPQAQSSCLVDTSREKEYNHKMKYIFYKSFSPVFLFFLILSSTAQASFGPANLRLDTDAGANNSMTPKITTDHNGGVYAVWIDDRNSATVNNVYFNRSSDYGQTWLANDILLNSTGSANNGKISIHADKSGHVYIPWVAGDSAMRIMVSADFGQSFIAHTLDVGGPAHESNFVLNYDFSMNAVGGVCVIWDGGGNDDEIYVNCSSDYGANWFAAYEQVNSDVPYPYDVHRNPAVCINDNGHVYAAWEDNRGSSGIEKFIFFNRSTDGGQAWPADKGITSGNGTVTLRPQVACDNFNNVFLSYHYNKYGLPANDYLYFNFSRDDGSMFSPTFVAAGNTEKYFLETDGKGNVYLIWEDHGEPSYHKIKFRRSSDYADSWESITQLSNANDVETGNFQFNVRERELSVIWENNEPWQGIYYNRSTNHGASWESTDIRVDNNPNSTTGTHRPSAVAADNGDVFAAWEDERNGVKDIYFARGNFYDVEAIRLEAEYILACQHINEANPYHGAINNIFGANPTWIVPRENALAILALVEANRALGDPLYLDRANLAADYLIAVQDASDGAWYDQYDQMNPALTSKSPTQTAEVMMALHKLGYMPQRYNAMKKGSQFLLSCQDPLNKTGNDDGLIGGGKDSNDNYAIWRWASDNAFAYWAFKAAEDWANLAGDSIFAGQCRIAAKDILRGINRSLYVGNMLDPDYGSWLRVIDENGDPVDSGFHEWINYAPQMLDVPAIGVGSTVVSDWIHNALQDSSGALITNDGGLANRFSPGLSFQASLAWLDIGEDGYADNAFNWAVTSGLWQQTPDDNNIEGGWIDWIEGLTAADWWLRFIDTSFYAITNFTGGYDFQTVANEPNVKPLIDEQADVTGTEGQLLEFALRATDPDDDYLTMWLNYPAMPANASMNIITDEPGLLEVTFSWLPDFTQADLDLYYFVVSDGNLTDEETVVIRINEGVAGPPTVYLNVNPQSVTAGEPFTVTVSAAAQAGLVSAWWFVEDVNNPAFHVIPGSVGGDSPVNGNLAAAQDWGMCAGQTDCQYQRTVIIDEPGDYLIKANARDALYPVPGEPHQASEGIGIPVIEVNVAPQFSPLASQIGIFVNEPFVLTVNVVDANGDDMTLTAQGLQRNAAFSAGPIELLEDGTASINGTLSWKPTIWQRGRHIIRFTSVDENGAVTISEPVTVTVKTRRFMFKSLW